MDDVTGRNGRAMSVTGSARHGVMFRDGGRRGCHVADASCESSVESTYGFSRGAAHCVVRNRLCGHSTVPDDHLRSGGGSSDETISNHAQEYGFMTKHACLVFCSRETFRKGRNF